MRPHSWPESVPSLLKSREVFSAIMQQIQLEYFEEISLYYSLFKVIPTRDTCNGSPAGTKTFPAVQLFLVQNSIIRNSKAQRANKLYDRILEMLEDGSSVSENLNDKVDDVLGQIQNYSTRRNKIIDQISNNDLKHLKASLQPKIGSWIFQGAKKFLPEQKCYCCSISNAQELAKLRGQVSELVKGFEQMQVGYQGKDWLTLVSPDGRSLQASGVNPSVSYSFQASILSSLNQEKEIDINSEK